MSSYPWAWTARRTRGLQPRRHRRLRRRRARVPRRGHAAHPNARPHDWAALVGSNPRPSGGEAGPGHWGPQARGRATADAEPVFATRARSARAPAASCATRDRARRRHADAVDRGRRAPTRAPTPRDGARRRARRPGRRARRKIAAREKLAGTQLSLPGDPRLAEGIDWGKQNMADLTQARRRPRDPRRRRGQAVPAAAIGTVAQARWIGAGLPDYPWIFATDAEYTAFASVTVGPVRGDQGPHARAARRRR